MSEPSTVLVVDDEIGPRESLRAILKPEYQVLVATEGTQAIKVVEQTPVDVVLLDLRMPGVSGVHVLERIKAINPDIEVILITGYASYETVLEALRLHAFDYIPKPFNIPQLRDLVRRAVTRRHTYVRKSPQEETSMSHDKMPSFSCTQLPTEGTAVRKELEELQASSSYDLQGPLHTIEKYSQMLTVHYESQLDARGKDALQQVYAASLTLTRNLKEVLSRGLKLAPLWATPVPVEPSSHAYSPR